MKIFPSSSIKKLDAYTIEHEPIASIDLMERAAQALTKAITNRWNPETPVTIFAGPGNNGGDALAVARMMAEKGYKIEVYLFNTKGELSPDCQTNKELVEMMEEVTFHEISTQFVPPTLTPEHLVIDGLFGSGLNKPLSGGFAAVVKYINASPAMVVSIDIPSGLMGEENTFNVKSNIIRADVTFSLQLPKLAFLFAENTEFVGEWELLDIQLSEEGIEETETNYEMLEIEEIRSLIKPRQQFAHKGNFGHALLIAGSKGMAGASVLAARACLRSGVGLLTVHAPLCNNDILQTSARSHGRNRCQRNMLCRTYRYGRLPSCRHRSGTRSQRGNGSRPDRTTGTLSDSDGTGCRRTQYSGQSPAYAHPSAERFHPHPSPERAGTPGRQMSGLIRTTDESLRTGAHCQSTYHSEGSLFRHYHPRRQMLLQPDR